MRIALLVLMLAGLLPIGKAIWAHRRTSLLHAMLWALAAWIGWCVALVLEREEPRYLALALTGCAGVAVLGARRPIVTAWNFVVLGLLAVMVWPMLESAIVGTQSLSELRVLFLGATVLVGVLNYLPTRLGPAALTVLLAGILQVASLFFRESLQGDYLWIADFILPLVPWLSWLGLRLAGSDESEFDRMWRRFRDSWGMMWGQRMREQFNLAARNGGWGVRLSWRGLVTESEPPASGPAGEKFLVETLRNVLQRFMPTED